MNSEAAENLKRIRRNIEETAAKYRSGEEIRLMAVTKTVPYETVNQVIDGGVTLLGENRVQEYLEKKDHYRSCAEVHFIGHLQTNKVKYIIDSVSCIHSVDSIKLAKEIDRLAGKHGKIMDVLIEVNIGGEGSKSGVSADMLEELVYGISEMNNIRLKGLMAIPPAGNTEVYFEKMHRLFRDIGDKHINNVTMETLSMGMSGDYTEAIRHGSNLVRIGSALFGARK